MNKNQTFLAIIPARGGSKRLPKKNILDLNGKPLIAHTIEAAKQSKYITKTIVTSDSDEILKIASTFGSDIIKRPNELSTDTASTFDAIEHTILQQKEKFDYIVLLQPTSPLRTAYHVDEAIELLLNKCADAVISTCEVEHPVQWSRPLQEDLDMTEFIQNINTKRSQELEKYYRLNGAIYITENTQLLKEKTFFLNTNTYAYVMDKNVSIDIDDEYDFLLAQSILKLKENK